MTPLSSRDWFGKASAALLLGFALALGVSGLLPRLGVGAISYMKPSGQVMMWLIAPIWCAVLAFGFLFRSGTRAWLILGLANLLIWGTLLLLGGLRDMKLRTDVVRMYRDIHGWAGIVCGLMLFVAFLAGAITMFEAPLQRWASPPSRLSPPPSLADTPRLVAKVLQARPDARRAYDIVLRTGPEQPGRVRWSSPPGRDEHAPRQTFYASLGPDGALQVATTGPSPVADFIDRLHQQAGLPLPHAWAMPIVGAVALLYAVAIVSGVIALLPSLVKDLFALRFGRNLKRMWLDLHNVLGVFSLPFHLVMALTSVVFAFHDQFYDLQGLAFAPPRPPPASSPHAAPAGPPLTPVEVLDRLRIQAPQFEPQTLSYGHGPGGRLSLRVAGVDARHGLRGPTSGFAGLDPHSGRIIMEDYMPGRQDGWAAAVTSFFTLHFGSFGGAPIRWSYFLLGLAGAGLFYTGNLLWIESRRRRERRAGPVAQTRSTRILAALTVGVSAGAVAGVAVTVAAAKLLGGHATLAAHSGIYYAVFLGFTGWAVARGSARAASDLAGGAAAATLLIPLASLLAGPSWYPDPTLLIVDALAVMVAAALLWAMRAARRRAVDGPHDSVWSVAPN